MSKLLFNEHPLVVDKELAALIGLNEAIVLQQIHYWLQINEKANKNYYEGKYWTYNTINEWREEFHFWSYETVKRTLSKLRKLGVIITENFNKRKMDRTLWYSINYDLLEELYQEKKKEKNPEELEEKSNKIHKERNIETKTDNNIAESIEKSDMVKMPQCNRADCSNGLVQNDSMQKVKVLSPIPEITTEITKRDIGQSVSQEKYYNSYTKQRMSCDQLFKHISQEIESMRYVHPFSEMLQNSLRDIFYAERMIKGNDNYFRRQYAIKLCEVEIIDFAISKFKNIDIKKIKNPHGYFTTILYTSIFEYSANAVALNAELEKEYS